MRSAEYGMRRDAISGDTDFGMYVQHVQATTPLSSARSDGLGAVRLGIPHIINRHKACPNCHGGISRIRGEGLESPQAVVLRRRQLLDSGHSFGHYSFHNELLHI